MAIRSRAVGLKSTSYLPLHGTQFGPRLRFSVYALFSGTWIQVKLGPREGGEPAGHAEPRDSPRCSCGRREQEEWECRHWRGHPGDQPRQPALLGACFPVLDTATFRGLPGSLVAPWPAPDRGPGAAVKDPLSSCHKPAPRSCVHTPCHQDVEELRRFEGSRLSPDKP